MPLRRKHPSASMTETVGIDWPVAESQLLLSEKDGHAVSFKDAEYFE